MEIILKSLDSVVINDLGLELELNQEVNLLECFSPQEIILSQDLEPLYNNSLISFMLDNEDATLVQIIQSLTGLSEYKHGKLNTLKHELSEQSFFQVERDINDDVKKIVYYKDNTLAVKIREDEIVRDNDGDVVQMIKRQYENGVILQTETQIINRLDGDVISIETITT